MTTPPLPPPPRRVRPTTGNGCLWALAAPFIVLGVGMAAVVAIRLAVRWAGRPVTVVVESAHAISAGRRGELHYVRFRYDWDGRVVDDEQKVTADEAARARPGAAVAGRAASVLGWDLCLADVGSVGRQTATRAAQAAVWCGGLCVVGFVAVIVPRRTRRLLETGTAAAGEVVSVFLTDRRSAPAQVTYRFDAPDGPRQSTMQVSRSVLGDTAAGRPVTVVYDPRRSERNTVFELAGYTLVSDRAGYNAARELSDSGDAGPEVPPRAG